MMFAHSAADRPLRLVVLSFEGPDPYAQVGGLGVRVSGLVRAAAEMGIETPLIFIGDPDAPPRQAYADGRLVLHRWCQWISRYHPAGVYDGEWGKVQDFAVSVPPFVASLVRETIVQGGDAVVLAEEWQTAEALCKVADLLRAEGAAEHVRFVWNCNHPMCLGKVDWSHLRERALITTVSRYMHGRLREVGIDATVIPNGIPASMLMPAPQQQVEALGELLRDRISLVKVGRWDPDKAWLQAVEAVALLKEAGAPARLLMRGGREPHGAEVLRRCRDLGLSVRDVTLGGQGVDALLGGFAAGRGADVLNLRFPLTEDFKRLVFRAGDAVLANSSMEPFGLVGLEAMAAGGVAVVGSTGEDYANHENVLRLAHGTSAELAGVIATLAGDSDLERRLRTAGPAAACRYTWERVLATAFLPTVRPIADSAGLTS